MIYFNLNDQNNDAILSSQKWKNAVLFLQKLLKTPNLESGRYDFDEKNPSEMYAKVSSYLPKPYEEGKFETHKDYADLQYLISGEERFYVPGVDVHTLTETKPYNPEKDTAFQKLLPEENCTGLLLNPQTCVIVFPGEAHAPGLATSKTPAEVKKIVIKIKY